MNATLEKTNYKSQQAKNTVRLMLWTLAWTLSVALVTYGPRVFWDAQMNMTLLSIALNVALGVGMIWANITHLRGLDELQQQIQFNAMGITLGVGLVVGMAFNMLDNTGLIADIDVSSLFLVMGPTYIASVIFGTVKMK